MLYFLLISEAAACNGSRKRRHSTALQSRAVTPEQGVLKLAGLYARKILETAGLNADLAPMLCAYISGKGLEVALLLSWRGL